MSTSDRENSKCLIAVTTPEIINIFYDLVMGDTRTNMHELALLRASVVKGYIIFCTKI